MNFSGISNETFLGKALRLPLRLIPDSMPMRVLQGPLRGKKWIAGSSNHGCWLGTYEYSKQKAFAAAVRRGDVVYDLGANVGFYSLLASVLAGPEGRVFSFEPAPRNLALLRKHLWMNRATNCTVMEAAVGRSEGTAQFEVGSEPSMGHLTGEAESGLAVRVVTLDGLVATGQLPPPNVVKCDIEGAEFDALTGAAKILEKHMPTIFLATHGREVHEQCCGLLAGLQYVLTPLDELPLQLTSEVLATRRAQ